MTVNNKGAIYLAVPAFVPDKILGSPITSSFATTNAVAISGGAAYCGTVIITNPLGKKAFPVSRFTENGTDYYTSDDQVPNGTTQNVVVITAVTATQIKYRWAANAFPFTVHYETVLLGLS